MKKIILRVLAGLVGAIFVLAAMVQFSFTSKKKKTYEAAPFEIAPLVKSADVELGKRLYNVRAGCIDCHGETLSGRVVMENPAMGNIKGANITPFNLKDWSDEEIARAIRYGIHKTGRSLQFMPSFDYTGLSLGDTAALIAYLRTVAPVEEPSQANTFGPVAKVLSSLGKMPVMFPAEVIDLKRGFGEKPPEGPTLEFGRYLAHSCVGCHGEEFRGGKIPGGDPAWPAASNIRLGAGGWTEEMFKSVIASGISPTSNQKLRPPMPVALLAQMNDTEIKALWLYLSSLN
jgi:mono/diheme cytochrome c family protein